MAAVAWWLIAGPEWIRDHDWNVVGEVHDKIEFWPWLTFALCLDLAAAVYLAISLSGWLLSTFTPWAPIWHDSARQMVNVTAAAIVANGWLYFTKGDTNG
ncbi:MAG: hypothetical protein S0880_10335 [Actinomycetota bacterium]|nr:hypothetical protein [Actinomycetota bacterium]